MTCKNGCSDCNKKEIDIKLAEEALKAAMDRYPDSIDALLYLWITSGLGVQTPTQEDLNKFRDFDINYPLLQPSHCKKCGLELSRVMGYVCTQHDCPTGLGPTLC